jgi:hypothetical protein
MGSHELRESAEVAVTFQACGRQSVHRGVRVFKQHPFRAAKWLQQGVVSSRHHDCAQSNGFSISGAIKRAFALSREKPDPG